MFEILDNFTKTPNVIFVIMKFTTGSEYKIVLHIVRQTMGYNKKSDGISISQFVESTGLSMRQVNNSIKSLKEKKIINVTGQTQKNGGKSYNRYSINMKGVNTLVQKLHKGTAKNAQGVLQKLHKGSAENAHTKENRQNTIKQKINKNELFLLEDFYQTFSDYKKFVSVETLLDFIRYRREIKKDIKTSRALKSFIDALSKCVKAGYVKDEVIELMKNKEWQSIKLEWVQKELGASDVMEWH